VFYMNQTNFFTGQEVCSDGIRQTVVFSLIGPFCSDLEGVGIYPLYKIDPTIPLTDLNIAWDHACNLVVLQPEYLTNGTIIATKQVSEYDGQVRPQVNYGFEPINCENCWKKVHGFGGLDFGNWSPLWKSELYCGDNCAFYTIEEQLVGGEPVSPRAIIGRSYRTDQLKINITDSIQAQTISWNPFVKYMSSSWTNQFVGVGICCTKSWCHADCKDLDSHMVLFSFTPYSNPQITILADIGNEFDEDTGRLGVEYSPIYANVPRQAYVWYQKTVITFDIVVDDNTGLVLSAKPYGQSPKIDADVVVWSPGFSY